MTEIRLLSGGIDTDSADFAVDNGALLNAVNVRAIGQQGQDSGSLQFIDGSTEATAMTTFLSSYSGYGTAKRLGWCGSSDSSKLRIWLHLPAVGAGSTLDLIVSYEIATGAVTKLLDSTEVTGGLGWTSDTIISCEETPEGLLIFTDGVADVRYINTGTDYSAIAPITPSQLSLITEPPVVPLAVARATDATIVTSIQLRPIQFTYRITNADNFVSVLAPYSTTALPVRESSLQANQYTGNVIDVTVGVAQKFPANWKSIEFVVRYLDSNTFYVVRQFSIGVPADLSAINAHNNGTALSIRWKGAELYPLEESYTAKQFDSLPIKSNTIKLAASRLLLAGNTDGYNTPVTKPALTVSLSTYTTSAASAISTEQAYLIYCLETGTIPAYYAIIIRRNNKNYLLPKEFGSCGTLSFKGLASGQVGDKQAIWNLPEYIHESTLIELEEDRDSSLTTTGNGIGLVLLERSIRESIIKEANNASFSNTILFWYCGEFQTFQLVSNAPEFGSGGKSRCFVSARYKYGMRFYDSALRSCGVMDCGEITPVPYGVTNRLLTESATFTIANGAVTPPPFAAYYALTLSAQQKAQTAINFHPGLIKVALKDYDDKIHYRGYEQLLTPPTGFEFYGIAIPFGGDNTLSYSFREGDFIELIGRASGFTDTPIISLKIRAFVGGYLICFFSGTATDLQGILSSADSAVTFVDGLGVVPSVFHLTNSGTRRQGPVFATLYTGKVVDNHFEIAKFGTVANGLFGNFFDTGTLSTTIFGDHHTQIRKSATGSHTGFSYTTNNRNGALITVGDHGRIALTDTIGQKVLPTAIRWSNTNIPGTNTNGYASFDALDQEVVEQHSGAITALALTTKGIQEGGQLLILCENGSYVALIGKQQIVGADQNTAFIAQAKVLGDINPIKGRWACRNPYSVVEHQGNVFWADTVNKAIVQFSHAGAEPISKLKAARLWQRLLDQANEVYCGINPYTSELMVSVAVNNPTAKPSMPTFAGIPDHYDAWYPSTRTYIYNWITNKWVCSYQSGGAFITLGDNVISWLNSKLYAEYTNLPGHYYGQNRQAIITVPFNQNYPAIKSPRSIRVVADRKPDQAYLRTETGDITTIFPHQWRYREGTWMAPINRNRKIPGATTTDELNRATISGPRLKGKVINAVLIWEANGQQITVSSVQLNSDPSGGQR